MYCIGRLGTCSSDILSNSVNETKFLVISLFRKTDGLSFIHNLALSYKLFELEQSGQPQ